MKENERRKLEHEGPHTRARAPISASEKNHRRPNTAAEPMGCTGRRGGGEQEGGGQRRTKGRGDEGPHANPWRRMDLDQLADSGAQLGGFRPEKNSAPLPSQQKNPVHRTSTMGFMYSGRGLKIKR